jgi:hypothetical protein
MNIPSVSLVFFCDQFLQVAHTPGTCNKHHTNRFRKHCACHCDHISRKVLSRSQFPSALWSLRLWDATHAHA